jgi:hypothetical protein
MKDRCYLVFNWLSYRFGVAIMEDKIKPNTFGSKGLCWLLSGSSKYLFLYQSRGRINPDFNESVCSKFSLSSFLGIQGNSL